MYVLSSFANVSKKIFLTVFSFYRPITLDMNLNEQNRKFQSYLLHALFIFDLFV